MKKELHKFARDCVNQYARFDNCDRFYNLHVNDLPDFVQDEFAALIMAHDENYASEAVGPDNADWDMVMLPSLLKHLQNSTDKETATEFSTTWRRSITKYCLNKMQDLIDTAVYDFNDDGGYIKPANYYYGVSVYG